MLANNNGPFAWTDIGHVMQHVEVEDIGTLLTTLR